MAKTHFVLAHLERTGSTFLTGLLNSMPGVRCVGEVFDDFSPKEAKPGEAEHNLAILDRFYGNPKFEVIGFKFKYPYHHDAYPEIEQRLLERRDEIRMLGMYRENFLKIAVSKQNQRRLLAKGMKPNLKEVPDLGKLDLDVKKAVGYSRMVIRQFEELQAKVQEFPHHKIVTYEQLLADHQAEGAAVAEFLGVRLDGPLETHVSKITPNLIKDAISNFDELTEAVTGTELERFLDT